MPAPRSGESQGRGGSAFPLSVPLFPSLSLLPSVLACLRGRRQPWMEPRPGRAERGGGRAARLGGFPSAAAISPLRPGSAEDKPARSQRRSLAAAGQRARASQAPARASWPPPAYVAAGRVRSPATAPPPRGMPPARTSSGLRSAGGGEAAAPVAFVAKAQQSWLTPQAPQHSGHGGGRRGPGRWKERGGGVPHPGAPAGPAQPGFTRYTRRFRVLYKGGYTSRTVPGLCKGHPSLAAEEWIVGRAVSLGPGGHCETGMRSFGGLTG